MVTYFLVTRKKPKSKLLTYVTPEAYAQMTDQELQNKIVLWVEPDLSAILLEPKKATLLDLTGFLESPSGRAKIEQLYQIKEIGELWILEDILESLLEIIPATPNQIETYNYVAIKLGKIPWDSTAIKRLYPNHGNPLITFWVIIANRKELLDPNLDSLLMEVYLSQVLGQSLPLKLPRMAAEEVFHLFDTIRLFDPGNSISRDVIISLLRELMKYNPRYIDSTKNLLRIKNPVVTDDWYDLLELYLQMSRDDRIHLQSLAIVKVKFNSKYQRQSFGNFIYMNKLWIGEIEDLRPFSDEIFADSELLRKEVTRFRRCIYVLLGLFHIYPRDYLAITDEFVSSLVSMFKSQITVIKMRYDYDVKIEDALKEIRTSATLKENQLVEYMKLLTYAHIKILRNSKIANTELQHLFNYICTYGTYNGKLVIRDWPKE